MTIPHAWLIDTNVVSEIMRRQPEPRVAACLDSVAGEGLGIASITVWEILDGIGRLPHGRRRESLAGRFFDLLVRNTGVTTVNSWTAAPAGRMRTVPIMPTPITRTAGIGARRRARIEGRSELPPPERSDTIRDRREELG